MSDANTIPTAPQTFKTILYRLSMPFLLFSGSLFGLLFLSWALLLPRFTKFQREDGTAMSPRQLAAYEHRLAGDLVRQEEERVRMVLPITNEAYGALKDYKHSAMSLAALQEQLRQAASRLGEPDGVVAFTAFSVDKDKVVVEGDVRNVGTRSMTVLAAFIGEVEKLPFVSNLERPPFAREQSADGSFHSPFTMSFSVKYL